MDAMWSLFEKCGKEIFELFSPGHVQKSDTSEKKNRESLIAQLTSEKEEKQRELYAISQEISSVEKEQKSLAMQIKTDEVRKRATPEFSKFVTNYRKIETLETASKIVHMSIVELSKRIDHFKIHGITNSYVNIEMNDKDYKKLEPEDVVKSIQVRMEREENSNNLPLVVSRAYDSPHQLNESDTLIVKAFDEIVKLQQTAQHKQPQTLRFDIEANEVREIESCKSTNKRVMFA